MMNEKNDQKPVRQNSPQLLAITMLSTPDQRFWKMDKEALKVTQGNELKETFNVDEIVAHSVVTGGNKADLFSKGITKEDMPALYENEIVSIDILLKALHIKTKTPAMEG